MNLDEFLKQNGAGARGAENSPAPAPSAQPVREGHLDIDALIGQYGVKQPTQAGASVTIPGVTAPAAPAMPSAPAAAPSVPAAAELPTSRMQPALIEAPKLKMKSAVDELLEAAKGVGGSLFRAKEAEPPTQAQAPRAETACCPGNANGPVGVWRCHSNVVGDFAARRSTTSTASGKVLRK